MDVEVRVAEIEYHLDEAVLRGVPLRADKCVVIRLCKINYLPCECPLSDPPTEARYLFEGALIKHISHLKVNRPVRLSITLFSTSLVYKYGITSAEFRHFPIQHGSIRR